MQHLSVQESNSQITSGCTITLLINHKNLRMTLGKWLNLTQSIACFELHRGHPQSVVYVGSVRPPRIATKHDGLRYCLAATLAEIQSQKHRNGQCRSEPRSRNHRSYYTIKSQIPGAYTQAFRCAKTGSRSKTSTIG